jgi:hypothetical protein
VGKNVKRWKWGRGESERTKALSTDEGALDEIHSHGRERKASRRLGVGRSDLGESSTAFKSGYGQRNLNKERTLIAKGMSESRANLAGDGNRSVHSYQARVPEKTPRLTVCRSLLLGQRIVSMLARTMTTWKYSLSGPAGGIFLGTRRGPPLRERYRPHRAHLWFRVTGDVDDGYEESLVDLRGATWVSHARSPTRRRIQCTLSSPLLPIVTLTK